MHIDAPDNDVTLETNTGIKVVGKYRFLRSIDQEQTFAFCCSTRLDDSLFEAFNADTCVAIVDAESFFLRCATAARRHHALEQPGFLHRNVSYFHPNREAPLDVTVPHNLPFLKHSGFADQQEYRAMFARRGGFTTLQRIVQPAFTFAEEIASARQHERLLKLGDIRRIPELARKDSDHAVY